MYIMTAGDCDRCRHCAQWTHGSRWTGRAQTAMVMDIPSIIVIAVAHRGTDDASDDEKVRKDGSTARVKDSI